jgi:hypothetical protein
VSDDQGTTATTERPSGGYQRVADDLTRHAGVNITRQRVWMWWKRRGGNGFPEGWERPTLKGAVRRFHLDEVREWYDENYPPVPPAPRTGD